MSCDIQGSSMSLTTPLDRSPFFRFPEMTGNSVNDRIFVPIQLSFTGLLVQVLRCFSTSLSLPGFTDMALLCSSCRRGFSHTGYTLHGQHSSNQECRDAYRRAILDQLLDDVESLSDTNNAPDESNELNPFIDLANRDVDWQPDDWFDGEQYSDPSDIDANLDANPLDNEALLDTDTDTDTDHSDIDDLEDGFRNWPLDDIEILPLNADDRVQFPLADPPFPVEHDGPHPQNEPTQPNDQDPPHPPETFIEKFSRGRAGAPLDDRDVPMHEQYQNKINNPDNVFEPFKSKIDWEFARWAKVCGASSTAVTQLLSIEGVRIGLDVVFQMSDSSAHSF